MNGISGFAGCMVAALILLAAALPGAALEPAEIAGARSALDLTPHLSYLADPSDAYSFERVSSGEFVARFQPLETERLNFGVIEGTYWLRFQVRNTSAETVERYLEIARSTMDEVELYRVGVAQPQVVHSDTLFYDRPVPARQPVFRLVLAPGETTTGYLRIHTVGTTSTDITLLHPDLFREYEGKRIVAMGLYFGMLLIMAAHYVLMFGIFRERSFLYLAAMVTATGIYVATFKGYTFQFIWPDAANLSQRFTLPWAGLTFSFSALFAERFLAARTHSPKLARALFVIAGLGLCVSVVNGLDAMWTDRLAYALGICTPLVIFATGLNSLRSGQRAAKIFLGAWSLLLLSTAINALGGLGIIPDNFVAANGPLLAFPVMLLILSFATWDRFKSLEEEHRDGLERRVEARTRELAKALENVRTLEGFIPICGHCKKVRDDAGYWSQIESYISTRSDAEFSHSVCPDCLAVHYPEYMPGHQGHSTSEDQGGQ